jgi:hypothetical protein
MPSPNFGRRAEFAAMIRSQWQADNWQVFRLYWSSRLGITNVYRRQLVYPSPTE